MATYYSPSGNLEVWEDGTQPDGYMTVEQWQAAHPVPSTPPTLEGVKAAKLAEINNGCQAALEALTPTYPERELHSFANQEREAREYKAAPDTAQTPLLSALAAARGIGLAELADKVLAKAAAFATASGHIIGQRQHMEDMLDACGSVDAVRGITVSYSLPGAGNTGGA